jgi:MFS family permease
MPRYKFTGQDMAILLLGALVTYGNYYCYDIPGALNVQIRDGIGSSYEEYQTQINLLYSAYSLPNIILPFFGGILIDRLSPNVMLVVFSLLVCAGQAVFSYGFDVGSFSLMLAGRVIFGLGAESLDVGQADITSRWFHVNVFDAGQGTWVCTWNELGDCENGYCYQ